MKCIIYGTHKTKRVNGYMIDSCMAHWVGLPEQLCIISSIDEIDIKPSKSAIGIEYKGLSTHYETICHKDERIELETLELTDNIDVLIPKMDYYKYNGESYRVLSTTYNPNESSIEILIDYVESICVVENEEDFDKFRDEYFKVTKLIDKINSEIYKELDSIEVKWYNKIPLFSKWYTREFTINGKQYKIDAIL